VVGEHALPAVIERFQQSAAGVHHLAGTRRHDQRLDGGLPVATAVRPEAGRIKPPDLGASPINRCWLTHASRD
jgi:hypothetical protein